MCVPAFYVHRYMGVQMTGKLLAMNWRVIFIGIIKRAKNTIKIDSALFCVMLVFVSDKDLIFSAKPNKPHPKHAGLTKYFKHNWTPETYLVQDIVYGCNVSGKLGALPPELRVRVPQDQIAQVTAQFHKCLEQFIADYYDNFCQIKSSAFEMSDMASLFGTKCILIGCNITADGIVTPWRGANGFVYKLSFPEINADYALKIFSRDADNYGLLGHGPWFEIPTAFAANHAEQNHNIPIYLASLRDEYYMLSKWAGDKSDSVQQKDKPYVIFHTSLSENKDRNYRNGRRIDFGSTKLTFYGKCSYKERKLARQMIAGDVGAVERHLNSITNKLDYKNLEQLVQKVLDECFVNQAIENYFQSKQY